MGYIISTWLEHRKDWDSICRCCGKCCYRRSVKLNGLVVIHYDKPCEHLDTETHLCRIYPKRFRKCYHCGKVRLTTALFNPTLPNDCAYRRMFRTWDKERRE